MQNEIVIKKVPREFGERSKASVPVVVDHSSVHVGDLGSGGGIIVEGFIDKLQHYCSSLNWQCLYYLTEVAVNLGDKLTV